MSAVQAPAPRASADRAPWSIPNRVGLIIGLIFEVVNVFGTFLPSGDSAQPGPPIEILVADTVLASIGVVLLVLAWFTRRRLFARLAVAVTVIVTLSAFPAFFVPGIPVQIRVLVAVGTLVALVSSILVLLPSRNEPATV